MNRETIIACYTKSVAISGIDCALTSRQPNYFSATPLIPEFAKTAPQPTPSLFNKSVKDSASLSQTVSFCSTLSRTPMAQIIFKDIMGKREAHPVFSELENQRGEEDTSWYFLSDKDRTIKGPLTTMEMDNRFRLGQINEKTKVKRRDEDDYYFFGRLVKRYYKRVLSQQCDLQTRTTGLSSKVIRFKKGIALSRKRGFGLENFATKNREERVISEIPRPNFLHLKDMLPEESDEEDESCYKRIRSNTICA